MQCMYVICACIYYVSLLDNTISIKVVFIYCILVHANYHLMQKMQSSAITHVHLFYLKFEKIF
jgi:hypothetical protein